MKIRVRARLLSRCAHAAKSQREIMKTDKKIFIAFLLNLIFSVLEFFGGIFTGSIAIISDAVHDFGDAASIGASYLLEKKSKKL
jgi:cobalt-zinc-cadmium efflux system protein